MRKRSYIYEEIIEFLVNRNLINEQFQTGSIVIPKREKVISNFLYKHSNINYNGIWTLYFKRIKDTRPVEFILDFNLLADYEKKFSLKLIQQQK